MNGQWWITDVYYLCPAFWTDGKKEMRFQTDGNAYRVYYIGEDLNYRPVTAQEAEAHLSARYTGTRAAATEEQTT